METRKAGKARAPRAQRVGNRPNLQNPNVVVKAKEKAVAVMIILHVQIALRHHPVLSRNHRRDLPCRPNQV